MESTVGIPRCALRALMFIWLGPSVSTPGSQHRTRPVFHGWLGTTLGDCFSYRSPCCPYAPALDLRHSSRGDLLEEEHREGGAGPRGAFLQRLSHPSKWTDGARVNG